MAQLDGQPWGKQLQMDFAALWADARGIRIDSLKDAGFSARDRLTRAPRLLGLTYKPQRARSGPFRITDAGWALLEAENTSLVFQRQVAKVQFGSPLHPNMGFEAMHIRPLTAIIYLLEQLGHLTIEELGGFVLTTLEHSRLEDTASRIRAYRTSLHGYGAGRQRAEFRAEAFTSAVREAYKTEIESHQVALREGGAGNTEVGKYVATKRRNLRDYADATMRYMVATGIFVRDLRAQALTFSDLGIEDGRFLLQNIGLEPKRFNSKQYDAYVLEYLGLPGIPQIRKDNDRAQQEDVRTLVGRLQALEPRQARDIERAFDRAQPHERLQVVHRAEISLSERMEKEEARSLLVERSARTAEVVDQFEHISDRKSDQVARPLAYEWNAWRAMVLINDAREVRGNFSRDTDGRPRSTAGPGLPDIVVEFEEFWLLVEVTLSTGARQYESEGEPIMRHLGRWQQNRLEAGDDRPVYALFVAEKISDTVYPFMRTQAAMGPVETYSGPIRVVPMNRVEFSALLQSIVSNPQHTSRRLKEFLEKITNAEFARQSGDRDWANAIGEGL